MVDENKLALFGGARSVTVPEPHFAWPDIDQTDIEAVLTQLRSSKLSYYRNDGIIKAFEDEFSRIHNAKFAISTSSGTASIHAAFFSLGLPVGSEVIVPAYTHLATVFPMLHVGLIPILCDIEDETGNIDPDLIEEKISSDTRAIAVTHQYGHIADMERIAKIAKKHGLKIIEDCSHSHGSSFNGQMAGTFGDVACFSLQSHKTVFGGEGGILLTNDPAIADRASLFGHFREKREFTQEASFEFADTGYGLKNRLHPLAAALSLEYLKKMPATIKQRAENYALLVDMVKSIPGIKPLHTSEHADRGGFFRFILKYKASELNNLPLEKYIDALKAEGAAGVMPGNIAKPIHYFPFFQKIENGFYPIFFKNFLDLKKDKMIYQKGDFPIAEKFSENTLQLPPFTKPSEQIIRQYVAAMHKIADNHRQLLKTQS